MKKLRKTFVMTMISILMLSSLVSASSNLNNESTLETTESDVPGSENNDLEKELGEPMHILTNDSGNVLKVYKGIVYEGEETNEDREKEKEIKYILKNKETGHFLNVYKGAIEFDEERESDIEIITPFAISKPTRIKWDNYTSDWSGTVNFTYTKYAFPSGYFVAWADEPFSVILYDYDTDSSFDRVHAIYTNGRYEVETGGGDFTYYCTLSNTNKGVPMTNAIYKSVPHYWHNN